MFVGSINSILKAIKEKGYKIVAFADDIVLIVPSGQS